MASEQPRIAFAPSRPLFGVPSASMSAVVDGCLVGGVHPRERGGELAVHVGDRQRHALAEPIVAAVPELHGLELAGGCPRGDCGPAEGARLELDVDLDGRVPPRVEDLPSVDAGDLAHEPAFARS